jgi:hypothetical protein
MEGRGKGRLPSSREMYPLNLVCSGGIKGSNYIFLVSTDFLPNLGERQFTRDVPLAVVSPEGPRLTFTIRSQSISVLPKVRVWSFCMEHHVALCPREERHTTQGTVQMTIAHQVKPPMMSIPFASKPPMFRISGHKLSIRVN